MMPVAVRPQEIRMASSPPPGGDDTAAMPNFKLLSADGHFAASDEEKKLLCFFSDGRLLIADGHALNPHVMSYRARLERMNRPFRVEHTNIETVAQAYRADRMESGGRAQEHSMMQVTAKDLLSKACRDRASDIHIRVKKTRTEIYFRIHNDLQKVGEQTREYGERLLATLYGVMTSVSDTTYKPTERQDASISARDKLPQMLYGVRIATAPASEGGLMVLRLLYNDAGEDNDLRRLGFSDQQAKLIQRMKDQPIGMNIISGPTGSGKSTTLQRILAGEIAESGEKIHVLTVEDPIEYPIDGAIQTAVTNASSEEDRSRMFSAAISNAMRLDPDTIMIGEIRDRASAQTALRASMTGHQVWTTVHANSALAIVDRLVDLDLPISMVADHGVVTGLISQRLVKLLCPHCKKNMMEHRHEVPEAVLARVQLAAGAELHNVCIAGPGCEHCRQRGTTGRTVVAEVIAPDAQFYDHLRAGHKVKAIAYWLEQGGETLLEHTIGKVAAGLLDPRMAEKTVGYLVRDPGMAGHRSAKQEAIRAV
jgi:general secretion pathway protein E